MIEYVDDLSISEFKDMWNNFYDTKYGNYGKLINRTKELFIRPVWYFNFLLENRPILKTDKVLEIGCGEGNNIRMIAPMVSEMHGIDISKSAITRAKKWFDNSVHKDIIKVREGHSLDCYEDNYFDWIFSITVFQHTKRKTAIQYFKESYQKLKKGGVVFFQFIETPYNVNNDLLPKSIHADIGWTSKMIETEIENAGFEVFGINKWDVTCLGRNKEVYKIDRKDKTKAPFYWNFLVAKK